MEKPITPTRHAAIDYSMAAGLLALPRLLGFSERAKRVFTTLGLIATAASATTEHRLSVKPMIPFKTHRIVDLASLPVFLLLPLLAKITTERGPRRMWLATLGGIVVVYALTDWDADPAT